MYKQCKKCLQVKKLQYFYKRLSSKDGYRNECIVCLNLQKKQNYQKQKTYYLQKAKQYYYKNRKKYLQYSSLYNKQYHQKYPWLQSYYDAKNRCTNANNVRYKNYGGRGIQFLLTRSEIEKLWHRSKAHLMKKPSIDRKDNDGHYIYENCRFIELSENSSRPKSKLGVI